MLSDDIIKEQILQLRIEIMTIETEINKLKQNIHDKKFTMSRLIELLEIRGVNFE